MAYAWDEEEVFSLPTRAQVEADLKDWCERLSELLDRIEVWVADRSDLRPIRSNTHSTVPRLLALGSNKTWAFPSLTLHKYVGDWRKDGTPTNRMLHVNSDSPWVIGTRGRVRIWAPKRLFAVADAAMEGCPDWQMVHEDGLHTIPFTKEAFLPILDELA